MGTVWEEYEARRKRRNELNEAIAGLEIQGGNFNVEEFVNKMQQFESNHLRLKRAKLTIKDFDIIKRIGVGSFGEVNLVQRKTTGPIVVEGPKQGIKNIFAMKTLKKSLVIKQKQVAHVIAERDILSAANNEWIVKLHYSFQVRLKSDAFFLRSFRN